MLLNTFRPAGRLRKQSQLSSPVRVGQKVIWTNPNTGQRFDDIEVLQVNRTVGAALLRGYRGGIIRGRQHIESFSARLEQLTISNAGGGK